MPAIQTMTKLDHRTLVPRLRSLQVEIRTALRREMETQAVESLSRAARDDEGDTIFGIDVEVEEMLLRYCERWGEEQHFTLVGEGLPTDGVVFGTPGLGGPAFRLLVDPIDGTRGLMFDKRSGWCLMGCAPDRGTDTKLQDVEVAVMTELPTTRQNISDVIWAVAGQPAEAERHDIVRDTQVPLTIRPSAATDLKHGFASVANFFPGGKPLIAELDEAIMNRAMGGWNPAKAEVYSDQYISTGGQLAEVMLGRDRFVLDLRPLVYKKMGIESALACRPYDLSTWLVGQQAGCVVCDPFGEPLDAPLDVTTNMSCAFYANRELADLLIPIVREEVTRLIC
ncbi:MAG: fructose-1,6-bisphosphatase/inositol monophosphatase family enzyme [Planctomycetota bacterium]|jgi:fructose-1,6-bisphosphatase/inositol monophosphatase family enzyme